MNVCCARAARLYPIARCNTQHLARRHPSYHVAVIQVLGNTPENLPSGPCPDAVSDFLIPPGIRRLVDLRADVCASRMRFGRKQKADTRVNEWNECNRLGIAGTVDGDSTSVRLEAVQHRWHPLHLATRHVKYDTCISERQPMDRARRLSASVMLLAGVLLGACSGGNSPQSSASPTPSTTSSPSTSASTPSSDPASSTQSTNPVVTTTIVEQTIDNAWLNYWKVSLTLTKYPRAQWPARVKAIAIDPIYGELLNSIRVQQDKLAQVGYGYVISHPYWPTPPTATAKTVVMGDCFDGSHAGTKVAKTGQVKTVGKTHTNIHATLVKGQDSKWRVHQIEYLKASC